MTLVIFKKDIKGKFFTQLRIGSELWYTTRVNGVRQFHVASIHWYEQPPHKSKLWSLTLLWLNFQIGFSAKPKVVK